MKQLKRSIQIMMFSLIVVIICKVNVLAAGNSISFSDPTAEKGETIIITVKVVSDSTALSGVDMTLAYDDSALEYTGGGSGVEGGSGSIKISDTASDSSTNTMSYELTFTALKAGDTTLKVSDYEVQGTDDSVISMDHVGSSSITVTDENTSLSTVTVTEAAMESEAAATVPTEEAVETLASTEEVQEVSEESDAIYVNEKLLTPLALPADAELTGYTKGTLEYNGETMEALVSDYMELYVVYMTDTQGNEDYYVYYKDVNQFTEFIKIDNGGDKFIVVLDGYPRDISVYGFERTSIMINDKQVGVAWKYTDELIAYSSAAAEYYLVGGLSESGVNTWYVYDFVEKTYQRYFVQPANLIEEESGPDLTLTEQEQQVKELNEALQKSKNSRLMVIGVLAFMVLILLIAVINMFLKIRILKGDIEDLENDSREETQTDLSAVKPKERPAVPVKERTSVKKKEQVEPIKKKRKAQPSDDFFDEEDVIPREMEDEIIKAKIRGKEAEEDEFEESLKLPRSKPKQKKATKAVEKEFNEDDFDFEFIDLDD